MIMEANIGENLKKAFEWFERAVNKEGTTMEGKCMDQALKYEQAGLKAGESWGDKLPSLAK